jgi:hypothetical protein
VFVSHNALCLSVPRFIVSSYLLCHFHRENLHYSEGLALRRAWVYWSARGIISSHKILSREWECCFSSTLRLALGRFSSTYLQIDVDSRSGLKSRHVDD